MGTNLREHGGIHRFRRHAPKDHRLRIDRAALGAFSQPSLARAADIQARRIDHHVRRPARLRLGQRQTGAAPRERGVVGHANAEAEQGHERAQQASVCRRALSCSGQLPTV